MKSTEKVGDLNLPNSKGISRKVSLLRRRSLACFLCSFVLFFLSLFPVNLTAQSAKKVTWYVGGGYNLNATNSEVNVDYDSGLHGKVMLGLKVPSPYNKIRQYGLALYEWGPSLAYNRFSSPYGNDSSIHIFWSSKFGRFSERDRELKNRLWPLVMYIDLGLSLDKTGSEQKTGFGLGLGIGVEHSFSPTVNLFVSIGLAVGQNIGFFPLGVQLKL